MADRQDHSRKRVGQNSPIANAVLAVDSLPDSYNAVQLQNPKGCQLKVLWLTSAAPIRDSAYLEEICSVDLFTSEDFIHHNFPSVLSGKHLEENIDPHIPELERVLGHDLT